LESRGGSRSIGQTVETIKAVGKEMEMEERDGLHREDIRESGSQKNIRELLDV